MLIAIVTFTLLIIVGFLFIIFLLLKPIYYMIFEKKKIKLIVDIFKDNTHDEAIMKIINLGIRNAELVKISQKIILEEGIKNAKRVSVSADKKGDIKQEKPRFWQRAKRGDRGDNQGINPGESTCSARTTDNTTKRPGSSSIKPINENRPTSKYFN